MFFTNWINDLRHRLVSCVTKPRKRRRRVSRAESMEDRTMLSSVVSIGAGGSLVVSDNGGTNQDVDISYDASTNEVLIHEANGSIDARAGHVDSVDSQTVRVDARDITSGRIYVYGSDGDDNISVGPMTGATGLAAITVDGGAGVDNIDLSALQAGDIGTVVAHGGADNDTITGSQGDDSDR